MSIEVQNISYKINNNQILKNVSLTIDQGKICSILGPNGSGKSTLIKIISGDIKPQKGFIFFNDKKLNDISIEDRAKIRSVMSQSQQIFFDFSVREIIEMGWIEENRMYIKSNLNESLQRVANECEISNLVDRKFNSLSGGEQRRVHFARTLIQLYNKIELNNKRFLILDEPTANLDLLHELKLIRKLKEKADEGFGVLIVLHDLNIAYNFSDKIALINNGEIKYKGLPDDIFSEEILTSIYKTTIKVDKKNKRINYY
jgi:iron complex transport system ATP-binding protein|tara:strand:+ start:17 stop:790 length:774 start_codon:yes stop_codon:yes gene_type:complete